MFICFSYRGVKPLAIWWQSDVICLYATQLSISNFRVISFCSTLCHRSSWVYLSFFKCFWVFLHFICEQFFWKLRIQLNFVSYFKSNKTFCRRPLIRKVQNINSTSLWELSLLFFRTSPTSGVFFFSFVLLLSQTWFKVTFSRLNSHRCIFCIIRIHILNIVKKFWFRTKKKLKLKWLKIQTTWKTYYFN